MASKYIPRTIEPVIRKAVGQFPAVILTGPRQAGKTTLLRRTFSKGWRYVSLETPDRRASAAADPRAFLEMYPPPVIFDEVHNAPELLPYIKERIDAEREKRGRYVLTGSQNILLMEKVTESLAGRAAVLRLHPLSRREAEGLVDLPFPWESNDRRPPAKPLAYRKLWRRLLRGWYPELVVRPGLDAEMWHSSYLQTYIERDVRALRQVGDLSTFQAFLKLLAARSAQLVNLSDIARDIGVAVNTIKAWISVLEASHQIVVVRPYFADVGKRLVKTPKVYFTDTGVLCHIAGLRTPEHASAGPMAGAIFETAVLSEIVKVYWHRGRRPGVYFWRTSAGTEVDFIVETERGLVPVEVKTSATPRPAMGTAIRSFRKDMKGKAPPGYVIHPGDVTLPLGDGVTALPFGLF